ncbi:MAG: hypothetical protein ACFE0O_08360 [Opitutales bacterium]
MSRRKETYRNGSSGSRTLPAKLHRRLVNPTTIGLVGALVGLVAVGVALAPQISGDLRVPLFFVLAVCALLVLIRLCAQPLNIQLREDGFTIRYLVTRKNVDYAQVERLHFHRIPTGLGGGRSKDTLMIELKNGRFLKLDYMKGQLRRIRGYLENRVYGPSL